MLKLIKKQQGFTLLELLVVIAIIGLLASIVLVSYEGSTDKARIAKTLSWAGSVSHLLGDQAVGVWTFDNISGTTVYDDSGNNNNGAISGAAVVDGIVGEALSFDGVNDYVQIAHSDELTMGSLTVSAWIKFSPNETGSWMMINKASGGTPGSFYIYSDNPTSATWSIFGPTGTRYNAFFNTTFVADTWYYLAASFDNLTGEMNTYVNGNSKGAASGAALGSNTSPILIGRYTSGYYFNGLIDDVRIYSEALPQARIEQLYADGLKIRQPLAKQ